MEIAVAIGIVGTLGVIAAWHTALRGIGRRTDAAALETLRSALAQQQLATLQLGERIEKATDIARRHVAVANAVLDRVEPLEKRTTELAAHVALRPARERQRA